MLFIDLEVTSLRQMWFHVFVLARRCSSQLPPLLFQPQLPHTEPEQASAAAPPQQPRPHYQGEHHSSFRAVESCDIKKKLMQQNSSLHLTWFLIGLLFSLSYRIPITSCSAVWKTWSGRGGVCLGSRATPLCLQTGNTTSLAKTQVGLSHCLLCDPVT